VSGLDPDRADVMGGSPMDAQRTAFPARGGTTEAYLARPDGGEGPGIIVLQEWWGLVPHIEDLCRRFAAEGFTALAPDLYHGTSTRSPDEAGKLMMALEIERTEQDLKGAVDFLAGQDGVSGDRVGVVGFCMGGQLALFAAGRNPAIGACVDFYGIHPAVHPDYPRLQAPVLGFFGDQDQMVTPDVVTALDAVLTAAGKTHEFHTFPGAGHAFFNDTRTEVYDPAAAGEAWTRMLAFFRKHLG
jgi:carboxymethylenebutenolidase